LWRSRADDLRTDPIDVRWNRWSAICLLNYGHSSGRVQNQTQFVDEIASGHGRFTLIELKDQTIDVVGDTAIVRRLFTGEAVSEGKAGPVSIKVLQVWKREGNSWRLLARQAVKA
jgi:hypothetical protein